MKNTIDILNKEFAKQDFSKDKAYDSATAELINTAYNYAKIENAIAVLSDLRAKVSYIFYGKFSHAGYPDRYDRAEVPAFRTGSRRPGTTSIRHAAAAPAARRCPRSADQGRH